MKKVKTGASQYTRTYSDFRGVELGGSGSEISKSRLAYAENLYRDYDGDDGSLVESVPGYRRIAELDGEIHSLILERVGEGEEYLLIHAGEKLYRLSLDEVDTAEPTLIYEGMPEKKCAHFSFGGCVYVLCGTGMLRISRDGTAELLGEGDALPYVPTLTLNGEPYEQKNLLSSSFKTGFLLARPHEYSYGTPALRYKILDRELMTCAVSGIEAGFSDEVYVPAYTMIGGVRYRVTEIAERAFYFCTKLKAIHISEGVELIGKYAFEYCKSATVITLPNTMYSIGDAAFDNCQAMTDLYLGAGLAVIGSVPFVGCKALARIHYSESKEQFDLVTGKDATAEWEMIFSDPYGYSTLLLPLAESAVEVTCATVGTEAVEWTEEKEGELVTAVVITTDTGWEKPVEISVSAEGGGFSYGFGGSEEYAGDEILFGCTVAEIFDNRIFLGGNPELPNTVFYSAIELSGRENPLYFGSLCYFSDGVGGYPVTAMLAVGDSLAVFKSGDDGSGSIFYHTPSETGEDYIPKIYPRSYVHSGIGAVGAALSFMDDPVFLSNDGLYALDKMAINYDRSVVCRSHNVNYDLQKEDLSQAILTEWCGYLVIVCGERAYLADSRATFVHRTGGVEYEWFLIKGLGSYKGGRSVYRFDTRSTATVEAHARCDEVYEGTVYSGEDDGEHVLWGTEGAKRYSLYKTGELTGGTFYPATAALGCGKRLFFGTAEGALLIFNNDKRGVPPEAIASAADFDLEEYRAVMGTRIHPEFYSFDGRAVMYALKSAYDNCDIPHLTKSTVKHSLVIRCRASSNAILHCEVGTENADYHELTRFPLGELSFAEMNLSTLSLSPADYHTLPIGERERRWVEKQITLYSKSYAAPIGISSISYRYTVEGRVRRR